MPHYEFSLNFLKVFVVKSGLKKVALLQLSYIALLQITILTDDLFEPGAIWAQRALQKDN